MPLTCVSVRLLLKPVVALSDISKFRGAVAVMLAVSPLPETVNCRTSDEAVPSQPVILPVTVLAVIVGMDNGFTVMVKVVGIPGQPEPAVTKLPSEIGLVPTLTEAITMFVEVLITETLFEVALVTYTKCPSGLTHIASGFEPTEIRDNTVFVDVLITETLL